MESMAIPQPTLDMKKGFLNLSGRMNKKGTETSQKMVKPTISCVFVGILDGKVFFILANDGHKAVRHTLFTVSHEVTCSMGANRFTYETSLPPFQPVSILVSMHAKGEND